MSAKETQKSVQIKVSNPETIAKLEKLNPGISNPEFLLELLECYEKFNGLTCSTEFENFFPNLQGKEKQEKEPIMKEIFELDSEDPFAISECELLKKANELSGKSLTEMAIEGRILLAKNEIGREVVRLQGKSTKRKGIADDRIAQAYEDLKVQGQKVSINRLVGMTGSNRKTVTAWWEKNHKE